MSLVAYLVLKLNFLKDIQTHLPRRMPAPALPFRFTALFFCCTLAQVVTEQDYKRAMVRFI